LVQLPDIQIRSASEFEELERASQVLVDDEIYKKINEEINDSSHYFPQKVTKQEIQLKLYVSFNQTEDEINIQVTIKLQDNFKPSGLFKGILEKLHSENRENLLESFCKTIAHSHIKMHVYQVLIETLEEKHIKYKLKEKSNSPEKTIFSIFSESKKCKVIDVEISGIQVFATSYTTFCINKFIPTSLRSRIFLPELKSLIVYIIELQNDYLSLILDYN
jgi:hypothetical protein